ncbi:MAG: hypothetical protein ACE5IL_10575 [Myxococcota bacterium]
MVLRRLLGPTLVTLLCLAQAHPASAGIHRWVRIVGADVNGGTSSDGYRQHLFDAFGPIQNPFDFLASIQRAVQRDHTAFLEANGVPSGLTPQQRKDLLLGTQITVDAVHVNPGIMPVSASYLVYTMYGNQFRVPLFGGAAVSTGDSDSARWGEGQDAIALEAIVGGTQVRSDSQTNALILGPGRSLELLAFSKGLRDAGAPRGLNADLTAVIDATTCRATLAPNELLVFFELDAVDRTSSAYDFQDLVLKIATGFTHRGVRVISPGLAASGGAHFICP